MKIFITSGGMIWDPRREIFQSFKDDIVVVHLDKRQPLNIDGINTITYDYEIRGMGNIINGGFNSPYYKLLIDKKYEIEKLLCEDEDVIVLGDTAIHTVYILKVLQQLDKKINIHLWAIAPFLFEGSRKIEKYNTMLSDLRNLKSVTFTEPLKFINKYCSKDIKLNECIDYCIQLIDGLFEDHIRKIEKLNQNRLYFYDYYNEKFVYVGESRSQWEENNSWQESYVDSTMEPLISNDLLVEDMDYKEKLRQITEPVPRVDGKEVCRKLKQLRKAYADANNLSYFPGECHYKGPCAGTCAHCDDELKTLSEAPKVEFEIFPQYEIHNEQVFSKEEAERMSVGTMGFLKSPEE